MNGASGSPVGQDIDLPGSSQGPSNVNAGGLVINVRKPTVADVGLTLQPVDIDVVGQRPLCPLQYMRTYWSVLIGHWRGGSRYTLALEVTADHWSRTYPPIRTTC